MKPLLPAHPDFKRGFRAGALAGMSFGVIFFSFGVYAMQKNVPALLIPLFSLFIFAAPAQFAVLDMAGPLVPLWQIVAVGAMVNMRFFVWSFAMAPFVRHVPLKRMMFWCSFLAASTFLLPLLNKRNNPGSDFYAYYRGVVASAVPLTLAGTVLGAVMQGKLPPLLIYAASLFFPVYFSVLLANDIRKKVELASVAGAFALVPFLEPAMPGWGVVTAAAVSSTASLGLYRWIRRAG